MINLKNALLGIMLMGGICTAAADDLDASLAASFAAIEQQWVDIRYHTPDKAKKLEGGRAMAAQAAALAEQHPNRVEPIVWHAMGLLIEGEVKRDLSTLKTIEQAKALLERAEAMDPRGMDGMVQATLGSLYYEVPGWPVAFGDNKKAAAYLQKALEISPDSMDTNYFYGDYLLQRGKGKEALPYLEKASKTPIRPGHEASDTGRLTDVQEALDAARKAR